MSELLGGQQKHHQISHSGALAPAAERGASPPFLLVCRQIQLHLLGKVFQEASFSEPLLHGDQDEPEE